MTCVLTKGDNYLKILIASASLLIGGLIYVIYRTENLLMFSWFSNLGLSENILFLRKSFGGYALCPWGKYNMPAALWLFAYLYIIDAIWSNYQLTKLYKIFFWFMPILSILSEIFQLFHLLPGTFDILDMATYIMAIIIYFLINKH